MGEAFQRGIVRGFRRECVKQKENMRGKGGKKKGLEGARKGHKVVGMTTEDNVGLDYENSFFKACPNGFLFVDWTGTTREGVIVDGTPDGSQVRIENRSGVDLGWYAKDSINYVYRQ